MLGRKRVARARRVCGMRWQQLVVVGRRTCEICSIEVEPSALPLASHARATSTASEPMEILSAPARKYASATCKVMRGHRSGKGEVRRGHGSGKGEALTGLR